MSPALAVAFGQHVVVDQRMEAVTPTPVPDVPDERTVMEQLAVLLEELIAQPIVEGGATRFGEQFGQNAVMPIFADRRRAAVAVAGQKPAARRVLRGYRRFRPRPRMGTAVLVLLNPNALLISQLHLRDRARLANGSRASRSRRRFAALCLRYGAAHQAVHLLFLIPYYRTAWMAMEDPLRRIDSVGLSEDHLGCRRSTCATFCQRSKDQKAPLPRVAISDLELLIYPLELIRWYSAEEQKRPNCGKIPRSSEGIRTANVVVEMPRPCTRKKMAGTISRNHLANDNTGPRPTPSRPVTTTGARLLSELRTKWSPFRHLPSEQNLLQYPH